MAFLAFIIIIGLEGMHFGHFWLPRTPGGGQGGYGVVGGGPEDQKLYLFWEIPNFTICNPNVAPKKVTIFGPRDPP